MENELKEFLVKTEGGRRFVWSAANETDCKRYVERSGHIPTSVVPYKEDK